MEAPRQVTPHSAVWTLLVAVGCASVAAYAGGFAALYYLPRYFATLPPADMGKLSGFATETGVAYFVVVALLFTGYLLAWRWARGQDIGRRGLAIVLGFGLLMSAVLAYVYPITAIDLFGYISRGRVLGIHGGNPFLQAPAAYPNDPTVPYVGNWQTLASPYGPAWEWLAALGARLGGDDFLRTLLVFKGLAIGAYGACALLIWAILSRLRPLWRLAGTLLFAWNPLVLLETAANGHNDVVMLLPVLLAVWLLAGRQGVTTRGAALAFAALTLAAWVKFIPLLLGPLALVAVLRALPTWRARLSAVAAGGALAMLVTAALWLPIWPGADNLMVTREVGRISFSPAAWALLLADRLGRGGALTDDDATTLFLGAFLVAYLVVLLRTRPGAAGFAEAALGALAAYLWLGSLSFRHWYPLWLLPLAALSAGRVGVVLALAFSLLGELSPAYYTFGFHWWQPGLDWPDIVFIGIPLVFGVPLAVAGAYAFATRRRAAKLSS